MDKIKKEYVSAALCSVDSFLGHDFQKTLEPSVLFGWVFCTVSNHVFPLLIPQEIIGSYWNVTTAIYFLFIRAYVPILNLMYFYLVS